MDTLFFHYFSATGNTERAVKLCAAELAKHGHQTTLVPINTASLRQPALAQHTAVHIIAFPVLGFGPPDLIKQYLRRLSKVVTKETGLRAAVLATWGGSPFQALEETEQMLRRRGFEVLMSGGACYANNWTQLASAEDDQTLARHMQDGDAAIRDFVRQLEDRLLGGIQATILPRPTTNGGGRGGTGSQPRLYRTGIANRVWSGLVQLLFTSLGRRFLGVSFIADKRCTGCGICSNQCPVGIIRLKRQRPAWGAQCLGCNRCINRCPEQAIQISIPVLAIQAGLNVAALTAAILAAPSLVDFLGLPAGIHGPVEVALVLGLFGLACVVQLGPFNWLFQAWGRSKLLNGFFSLSWTKGFRRYPVIKG